MAKRLSIPRTAGEAERTLWHTLEYIQTDLTSDHVEALETTELIREAIEACQAEEQPNGPIDAIIMENTITTFDQFIEQDPLMLGEYLTPADTVQRTEAISRIYGTRTAEAWKRQQKSTNRAFVDFYQDGMVARQLGLKPIWEK